MLSRFVNSGFVDEGALCSGRVETRANFEGGDFFDEFGGEGRDNRLLNKKAIGA